MKEYIIPVAFDVTVPEDMSEMDAARALARALAEYDLPGREPAPLRIESWHMQNHPAADGTDHEGAVVFFPVHFDERRPGETPPEHAQRNIDAFLDTTRRWLNRG